MALYEDKAIFTPAQDELGRKTLVGLIVKAIKVKVQESHGPMTFGIYGAWGQGKTTIMRMVEYELGLQGVNCQWFNPWSFSNESKMVDEFFGRLASFTYPDSNFGVILPRYREAFLNSGTFQSNPALAAYQASLAKCIPFDATDIQKIKEEISSKLVQDNQHLVVFIDDVDRLGTTEVQTMFKLIRQVVDFNNVVYVLGLDPDVVSVQLGKLFGDNEQNLGRDYLEKIINVPIILPAVQDSLLEDMIIKEVGGVWVESGFAFDEKEMEVVASTLLHVMKTKRAIDRFANQLSFIVPTIGLETEFVDLCLLESLKYIDEQGWIEIYHQRKGFLKEDILLPTGKEREKEEKRVFDEAVAKVLTHYPERWKSYAESILKDHLFTEIHHYNRISLSKCINDPNFFNQYFIAGIPNEIIPRADIIEFAKLLKDNKDKAIAWINEKLTRYAASEIERSVCLVLDMKDELPSSKVAASLIEVLSFSDLTKNYGFYTISNPSFVDGTIYAYIIPRYMASRIPNGEHTLDMDTEVGVLLTVFEKAPLNFCMCLFTGIYSDNAIKPTDEGLFEILKKRVQDEGDRTIFKYSYPIKRVFFLEWKNKNRNEYVSYWKSLLEATDFDLGNIIKEWLVAVSPQDQLTEIATLSNILSPVIKEAKANLARSPLKEDKLVKLFIWNCEGFLRSYFVDYEINNIQNIMKNIDIFETLIPGERGKKVKMTILRTMLPPTDVNAINALMDAAVSEYVQTAGHNTFIEEHEDAPNIRIIISDLNDIDFKVYSGEHL